jgi:hypothetical protein
MSPILIVINMLFMLSVDMLNVAMLSIIMFNVVAPTRHQRLRFLLSIKIDRQCHDIGEEIRN